MKPRMSLLSLVALVGLSLLGTGCAIQQDTTDWSIKNNRELVVYVTNNAKSVREKAMSYGLTVKSIEADSAASQLVQALLNAPTGEYFVVINPFRNRYVMGGAVSNLVEPAEIDNQFRRLKMVSKAGVQQLDRLFPRTPGHAKLIVFSDFQCPYCKVMEVGFIQQLQTQYGDKLEVDMVHFPLPSHDKAFPAAEAAECARRQGKFEPYQQQLFEHQNELGEYVYHYIARRTKLDTKAFSQCLTLHQERKRVRQDQYFGHYMGVTGTPTLALNGEILFGLGAEEIQGKIEEALKHPVKPVHAADREETPSHGKG